MISPIVQPLPGPPRPIPAQTVAAGPKGVGLQNSRPPEPPGVPLPTSLRGSDTGDDAGEPLPTRPDHPQPQGVLTQAAPARLPNAVQVTATPASPVSQREVALAPAALTPPRPRPGEPEPAFNPMQPVTMPNRRQIPYEDLPPAMEAPKPLGPEFFRTQPGVPGPSTRGRAPATLEARPDDIATRERAPHQPGRGEAGSTAQVLDAVTTEDGEAPPAVTSDQVLASVAPVWRRSFSWLLDLLVIGGLSGGLLSLAATFLGGKPAPPSLHGFAALLFQLKPIAIPGAAAAVGMAFLYTLFFGVLLQGRTVGRLVLGIRLVDATGHAPGVGRAFVRAVFALISFALFLSGFWLSLFDRRGQTLHDKLTRTFVIRPV